MERGLPQLPIHRASIIIPDLTGMNFRVIDQQLNEIATEPVAPSKGHFTRNIDPKPLHILLINFIIQITGILKQIFQQIIHT